MISGIRHGVGSKRRQDLLKNLICLPQVCLTKLVTHSIRPSSLPIADLGELFCPNRRQRQQFGLPMCRVVVKANELLGN